MAATRASRRGSGSGASNSTPTAAGRRGVTQSRARAEAGPVGSIDRRAPPGRCSRMRRARTSQTKIARASHLARIAQGGFMQSGSVHRWPHNRRSRSFEDVASTARESRTRWRQRSNPAGFMCLCWTDCIRVPEISRRNPLAHAMATLHQFHLDGRAAQQPCRSCCRTGWNHRTSLGRCRTCSGGGMRKRRRVRQGTTATFDGCKSSPFAVGEIAVDTVATRLAISVCLGFRSSSVTVVTP